ncbi:hypothetical protein DRJ24_03275 [Candidatus Acetothermia bacterium]|nr:MAG: hypothetical protein DRJ24_03275 [Candidatus Acetothermia bacterium]
MRIGLFTDAYLPEISGVTSAVHWLREELERLGHTTYIYAPRYDRPMDRPRTFRFRSGPVFSYKTARMALPYNRAAVRSLRDLDIVHSHTPFSLAYVAMVAAHHYGIPHIQTYHTYLSALRHYVPRPIRPPVKAAEAYSALMCNRATAVTVPTESIRDELKRYGVRTPIYVVPFGPPLSLYRHPAVWSPREALGLPGGAQICLYTGRLSEEKNLSFLLRAFARIRLFDSRAVLVIAGDGPLRSRLEEEAEKLDLKRVVRFTGFLDRPLLVDLYKSADLFLFSSKAETQGLAIVEAMAGGTPAVAVAALGVSDVIMDGLSGVLVPEDEDAFARAALELLGDEERYRRLSRGALAEAERMSVCNSARRLIEIYEEALAGRPITTR